LKYFNLYLDIVKESGFKKEMALATGNLSAVYFSLGDLTQSLKQRMDALKIFEELEDKRNIAISLNNLGLIYLQMNNYSQAMEHFTHALEISREVGNKKFIAMTYDGLAICHMEQGDFSISMDYLQKELEIFEELGDSYYSTTHVYLQFGNIYSEMGNYPRALSYYQLALEKSREAGDIPNMAKSYIDIAFLQFDLARSSNNPESQEKFREASVYLSKSLELALEMKDKDLLKDIYEGLAVADSALERFDLAYEHHKLYTVYKDSLLDEESQNKMILLQIQYETEKKDEKLELLNKENEVQALQLSRQKIQRDGIIIILVFLFIVGFLIIRSLHFRKKLEKQNAIIQERKRISADLHDDVGTGLSEISLLSELVSNRTTNPEIIRDAGKIAGTSRELLDNIREIIWALNSNNDSLENLVSYIRWFASEYFEHSSVHLVLDEPLDVPQTPINGEYRRNVFYSVKEAAHNIVKHAEATEAEIRFKLEDGSFTIFISDNGKGMPEGNQNRFGNGIKNIMNRMEAIRGNVRIESQGGTRMILTMPV
jgi:signal transduction histidine kinase